MYLTKLCCFMLMVQMFSCTAVFSGYAHQSKNKFEEHNEYNVADLEDRQQIIVTTHSFRKVHGNFVAAKSDSTTICLSDSSNAISSFHHIPAAQIQTISVQKEALPKEPYLIMGLGLDSYLVGILVVGLGNSF